MSRRAMRRILWIAFVFLVPVPFFLVETGCVPVARLLMLAGVSGALIVAEGSQGAVRIGAILLFAQALLAAGLLWFAADLLSRLLARASPRRAALLLAVAVLLGVCLASSFEVYRTPFRPRSLHANLLHVFE